MSEKSVVYARIDSDLKKDAEDILSKLGITTSGAIQMFYRQIVLRQGIPFDLSVPNRLSDSYQRDKDSITVKFK